MKNIYSLKSNTNLSSNKIEKLELKEKKLLDDEEEFNLPQRKLIDVLYATSLVIGNFFIPCKHNVLNEEENDEDFALPVVQGYNLTHPTAQSFNVNGIGELISGGIGLHSVRLLQTQRPYNSSYSITFTNNLGENIVSSSAITTSLTNNEVRTDFVLGGGNYGVFLQNISINTNAYWINFCNSLNGNALQNVDNTPFLQDMLGLYCCEISRCPASLITIPIFYSMFDNNINIRNAVLSNFNNFSLTNPDNFNTMINNNNCVIPPIMLDRGTSSANTLVNGAFNSFINDFFQDLTFLWKHENQQPSANNIRFSHTKRFGILQEKLVSSWYNTLNNENQILLNSTDVNGYQGNTINNIQSNSVINTILEFFNVNFNMNFNNEDIADRIDLINDILEHPENTNWLIQEFNTELIAENQIELD